MMAVNGRANRLCPDQWFSIAVAAFAAVFGQALRHAGYFVGEPRKLRQRGGHGCRGCLGSLERGRDSVECIDKVLTYRCPWTIRGRARGITREVQ